MKLTGVKDKIVETFDLPGLLSGRITHNVKDGNASLKWLGPKISVELWHAVLAFFRDTFNDTKSECQVRLYVNTTEKKWAAWAFPQEAKTHMSAREVNNPDATEQRAMFKDSEGWTYCGTVHHHCDSGAFQSSTDRHNEHTQDGLHITIGKLGCVQYDMHARFYLSGAEFNPDMSAFWDIGSVAFGMVPHELHDLVARHQMTMPAPIATTYPDQWKANLIDLNPKAIGFHNGGGSPAGNESGNEGNGSGASGVHGIGVSLTDNRDITWAPEHKRREMALGELRNIMRAQGKTSVE